MSIRIYFCKDPVYSACLLIEKLTETNNIKILSLNLTEINERLWTFKSTAFIPHILYDDHIYIDHGYEEVIISIYKIHNCFASFLYLHDFHQYKREINHIVYYQKENKYEMI